MIPSNTIAKFVLRQCPEGPWLGALRAYSTARDLYSQAGGKHPMPSLRMPLGAALSARTATIRIALEQPCDRFTVYLVRTLLGSETDKLPTQMFVELFTGQDCAEESAGLSVLKPVTFRDAGEIMTIATPKLCDSIALAGTTQADPGALEQSVDLLVVCDRIGACCPTRYGPQGGPVQR